MNVLDGPVYTGQWYSDGTVYILCLCYFVVCFPKEIFRVHLLRMVQNLFGAILGSYGNPWKICPSPLLSCLLEGCVESGRDMTNGGSR